MKQPVSTMGPEPAPSSGETRLGTEKNLLNDDAATNTAALDINLPPEYRALMEQLVLPPSLRTGVNGWT